MCSVSMVVGHFKQEYPKVEVFPSALYPDYAELVRKARLYDEMMNQKDCPDPAKEAWHQELVEFMRKEYGLEPKQGE